MYSFTRCISSIIADRAALWKAERDPVFKWKRKLHQRAPIWKLRSRKRRVIFGASTRQRKRAIDVDQNRGSAVGVDRRHAVAKEGVAGNDTDYYCRGPCLLSQTEIHRIFRFSGMDGRASRWTRGVYGIIATTLFSMDISLSLSLSLAWADASRGAVALR